jgi:hypothetical protein
MPNLAGLILPTPNVSTGWGSTLNSDFTIIDNVFADNGSGTSVGLQVGTGKTLNAGGTVIAGGTLILGSGDGTNTVTAPTIRGAARTGTNAAGPDLTIDALNGTGTGGSGKVIFRTAPAGVAGTTANTMASRLEVNSAGAIGIAGANYGSANQVLLSGGSTTTPSWSNVDGSVITIPSQAQGDLLYRGTSAWVRLAAGTNGQTLKTGGASANPSWADILNSGTAQNTTSGTTFDFTGLPSWVRRVIVMINNVTLSSGFPIVQLGTSAGFEATLYTAGYSSVFGNDQNATQSNTTGFPVASEMYGVVEINKLSASTWIASIQGWYDAGSVIGGGVKTLTTGGGVLTQIRLTRSSTGTFSAGSVNILYF